MIKPITNCGINRSSSEKFPHISVNLKSETAVRDLIEALKKMKVGQENHVHLQSRDDEVTIHFPPADW